MDIPKKLLDFIRGGTIHRARRGIMSRFGSTLTISPTDVQALLETKMAIIVDPDSRGAVSNLLLLEEDDLESSFNCKNRIFKQFSDSEKDQVLEQVKKLKQEIQVLEEKASKL